MVLYKFQNSKKRRELFKKCKNICIIWRVVIWVLLELSRLLGYVRVNYPLHSCTFLSAAESDLWEFMFGKLRFLGDVSLWICALVVRTSMNVWMSHCVCVLDNWRMRMRVAGGAWEDRGATSWNPKSKAVHQPVRFSELFKAWQLFWRVTAGEWGGRWQWREEKEEEGGPGLIATNWIGCADQMGGCGSNRSCHSR